MIKTAWQKPAVKIAFWMTFSAIGFGCLMGLFRFVGQDLHVFVMSFWRFVFSFLLFLPWAMRAGPGTVRSRRMGLHVLRACFLIVASTSLITATLFMPLDEVTALSFTTPLFSVIGAVLFLRERAGLRRWLAMAVGFIGILIIIRPGFTAIHWAAILILISALTFAGVVLCGKVLSRSESPEQITFLLATTCMPISLLPALVYWQWPTPMEFFWIFLMAVSSNANMYGISRALQAGDASATQPYDFLRLPTTAAVGWLAFGETSDLWTWIGAAVIFASTIYVTRLEARRAAV